MAIASSSDIIIEVGMIIITGYIITTARLDQLVQVYVGVRDMVEE